LRAILLPIPFFGMKAGPPYMEEKILELLGGGYGPPMVASILGITESRISQLLADDIFASKVLAMRLARAKGTLDRDSKWDQLEDKLLKKFEDVIIFMNDPLKLLRALQVVNAAKRRGAGAGEGQGQAMAGTVVHISGPRNVLMQFITNGQNEVIEVGGRSMVPMASKKVMEELKARQSLGVKQDDDGRNPALPAPATAASG